jgi:hypothetical protein
MRRFIVRQTLVRRFPYAVSYVVDDERIVVIAVLHGHVDANQRKSRVDN